MTIKLNSIESQYDKTTLNDNFQVIADYINSELTHRNSKHIQANQFMSDVDLNGFKLLNVDYEADNEALTALIMKIALCKDNGAFDAKSLKIKNLANPTNPQDAATKAYVDELVATVAVDVDAIKALIDAGDNALLVKLNKEIADRIAGDKGLQNGIDALTSVVNTNASIAAKDTNAARQEAIKYTDAETARATDAEKKLANALDMEKSERYDADVALADSLHKEVLRAIAAEAELQREIDSLKTAVEWKQEVLLQMQKDILSNASAIGVVQADIAGLKSRVTVLETAVSSLQSESSSWNDRLQDVRDRLSNIESDIRYVDTEQATKDIAALQVKVHKNSEDIEALQTKLLGYDSKIKELNAELEALSTTIDSNYTELKNDISDITAKQGTQDTAISNLQKNKLSSIYSVEITANASNQTEFDITTVDTEGGTPFAFLLNGVKQYNSTWSYDSTKKIVNTISGIILGDTLTFYMETH